MITASGAAVAGLGLAGLRGPDHATDLGARLAAATGVDVVVVDDTEAALAGAFGAGPGVIVIAGTGSNALGQSGDGRTARAGGYGFLVGDEGSAYWFAESGNARCVALARRQWAEERGTGGRSDRPSTGSTSMRSCGCCIAIPQIVNS